MQQKELEFPKVGTNNKNVMLHRTVRNHGRKCSLMYSMGYKNQLVIIPTRLPIYMIYHFMSVLTL